MKILWLAASPCGSVRRYSKQTIAGGWLISLEDELKKMSDVDLSVAYVTNVDEADFVYDGVKYYPICNNTSNNKIGRVVDRVKSFSSIDEKLMQKTLRIIDEVKPDLIHIHGTENSFGLVQEYVRDIPILFSIQGLIAPYKEKYFSGIEYKDARKYEPLKDKLIKMSVKDDYRSFCYRAARERKYLQCAKFIAGRTFWDENISLALNPDRMYFVVNEIMRHPFYVKKWNKEHFSPTLRIVSTISGGIYKGFENVLKTASLLKQYSDLDFEWIVAGYNAETKWVKIACKATGISYETVNVKLLGRIDADKLSDVLVSSDIYVHVSHIENSPNSVCEAMLVGMPIIASFTGGTASILDNHHEGELVQDGDPYVLAGGIIKLYDNFELAKNMGDNARKRAMLRHNPTSVIQELLNAYNLILRK